MTLFLELVAVAALVLLNGFFVGAEYSLVTVRRTRMEELRQEGDRRAKRVLQVTHEPARFIAAMQLGVTVTSLAIGALGEHALLKVFAPIPATAIAVALSLLILTFFHVVAGELVPKGLALERTEQLALFVAPLVRGFIWLFRPLIWFLQKSSDATLRLLGVDPPSGEGAVYSEAELKMLLERSTVEASSRRRSRRCSTRSSTSPTRRRPTSCGRDPRSSRSRSGCRPRSASRPCSTLRTRATRSTRTSRSTSSGSSTC